MPRSLSCGPGDAREILCETRDVWPTRRVEGVKAPPARAACTLRVLVRWRRAARSSRARRRRRWPGSAEVQPAAANLIVGVHETVVLTDGAGDGLRRHKHGIDERRLAVIDMGHNGDVPHVIARVERNVGQAAREAARDGRPQGRERHPRQRRRAHRARVHRTRPNASHQNRGHHRDRGDRRTDPSAAPSDVVLFSLFLCALCRARVGSYWKL